MFYFMYLRLYGVVYLVNDHINNEREELLLFAIGGRGVGGKQLICPYPLKVDRRHTHHRPTLQSKVSRLTSDLLYAPSHKE